MAKLSPVEVGPSRTHVKNIFSAPPALQPTSSDESDTDNKKYSTNRRPGQSDEKTSRMCPAAEEGGGTIYCRVKKRTMTSSTQSWVQKDGQITTLNSRNKRSAPKPPSRCSHEQTRDSYSDMRENYHERNTGRHSLEDERERRRQHLVAERPGQGTSQDCGENTQISTAFRHGDAVRRRDVISDKPIGDGVGSRTAVIGRGAADVSSLEDNVTSVSGLSDYGTASSSSGYTSDLPDLRTPVSMRNQSPAPEHQQQEEEEEECVLDFDVEDEDEECSDRRSHTILYKEYKGEDFSRYLEDDQQSGLEQTPVAPPVRKSRYAKRSVGHVSQPSDRQGGSLPDSERKKGLKQRLSQIFTLSRQYRNATAATPAARSNIQNFSFADSKIGEHIASGGDPDRLITALSDVGLRQPWSGTDTLAFRTLSRRSDLEIRPKRSSSVGDILGRTNSEFGDEFESRRKSQMYDSKLLAKSAKKSGFWSKLGKSRKKRSRSQYDIDNTRGNPLTPEGASDVRL